MRIKCCCITCVIGEEDVAQSAEEQSLIQNEREPSEAAEVSPEVPFSPLKSVADASPEPEEDTKTKNAADILKKHHVTLSPQKSGGKEAVSRAVGILKKYASKHDSSKSSEIAPVTTIGLKISIKMMVRSDVVKIFAIEATNVLTALKEINADVESTSADELILVQIRTKILPTDVRGHSRKFEVYESLTGAMKFSNECLHTLTMTEFMSKQVRFRLYNVFKQKRDVLLGEYILDIPTLNLEIESCTMNVFMQLHEPNCEVIKPPEVTDTRRLLSSMSGSSGQSSGSSNRSFKTTIRRGDVRASSRKSIPTFAESTEAEGGEAKSPSSLQVQEKTEDGDGQSPQSPFQHMMRSAHERTENVEKLEHATEEMTQKASNFNDMSVRLREKYQKKHSKKKLK